MSTHGGKVKKASGTLAVSVDCNQAGTATLSGTLTLRRKKHRSKTFKLGPVGHAVKANVSQLLALKLPRSALKALANGASESVALVIVARNANGSGRATASIGKLKG